MPSKVNLRGFYGKNSVRGIHSKSVRVLSHIPPLKINEHTKSNEYILQDKEREMKEK
tara:strand:+ start:686 stop:856 length:171 start_codon:yes stop_codon:yes gene_type:complete